MALTLFEPRIFCPFFDLLAYLYLIHLKTRGLRRLIAHEGKGKKRRQKGVTQYPPRWAGLQQL